MKKIDLDNIKSIYCKCRDVSLRQEPKAYLKAADGGTCKCEILTKKERETGYFLVDHIGID